MSYQFSDWISNNPIGIDFIKVIDSYIREIHYLDRKYPDEMPKIRLECNFRVVFKNIS